MVLRITAAGRAALADADNVGINAVRITKVLVGSGQGPGGTDDDARAALRNQRDSAVAGGSTMVPARVLVRGDVAATAAYSITEIGLEAKVGANAPFLFAYWSNAGEVFAAAVDGVVVLVIAAVDVVAETPAALTIEVAPTVQANFSATFAGLTDTQAGALVASNYYRVTADGARLVAATAAEVLADLFSGVASARYVRKQGDGFQALTRGEVAQDLLAAIVAGGYLRRAAGGGFEGRTKAQVLDELLSGLADDAFVRVDVVGGERRLVGLTAADMRALFVRRWHLEADHTIARTPNWGLVGSLSVPAGWDVSGRVTVSGFRSSGVGVRLVSGGQTLASDTFTGNAQHALPTVLGAPGGDLRLEAQQGQHGQSFADPTLTAGASNTFLVARA